MKLCGYRICNLDVFVFLASISISVRLVILTLLVISQFLTGKVENIVMNECRVYRLGLNMQGTVV
jgi:hypothetical protein